MSTISIKVNIIVSEKTDSDNLCPKEFHAFATQMLHRSCISIHGERHVSEHVSIDHINKQMLASAEQMIAAK